jgi:hypothetical protein
MGVKSEDKNNNNAKTNGNATNIMNNLTKRNCCSLIFSTEINIKHPSVLHVSHHQ